MKTEVMVYCGNSPKMDNVVQFTTALASGDVNRIKALVREDFFWRTIGRDGAVSYDDLPEALAVIPAVKELKVESALSHGNSAMCEGALTFDNGEVLYFCNVVKFTSTAKDALIKEARTYAVLENTAL